MPEQDCEAKHCVGCLRSEDQADTPFSELEEDTIHTEAIEWVCPACAVEMGSGAEVTL